ncbi:MAG: hypothetical protein FD138_3284 [Planctomycetota bacterium]|nr:MAG: hypothetical protein FD138_3284 [Planctomycetota bacterium]
MRIVFTPDEVKPAVDALERYFNNTLGPAHGAGWTVPPATQIQINTWEVRGKPTLSAIGFGRWRVSERECTFFLLAAEGNGRSGVWTPMVEVNIPDGGTKPTRNTQGCICVDDTPDNSTTWIGHRGTNLRRGQRIPVDEIKRAMNGWLRDGIQDGAAKSEIIVIGQVGPGFVDKLDCFVEAVQRLKQRRSPKP